MTKLKLTIGVMGSAKNAFQDQIQRSKEVGKEIAKKGHIILTGATIGLPRAAANAAMKEGGIAIGISPSFDRAEQIKRGLPLDDTHIIYTGLGFLGRNIINIRSSDGLIFIGGSNGTLNEFTAAYSEGKIIGILKNSKGFSSHIECVKEIVEGKNTGAEIIIEENPKKLVEAVCEKTLLRVENQLKNARHFIERE